MKKYNSDDIRGQFKSETNISPVFANREPYISYIKWLESKILNKLNDGK